MEQVPITFAKDHGLLPMQRDPRTTPSAWP